MSYNVLDQVFFYLAEEEHVLSLIAMKSEQYNICFPSANININLDMSGVWTRLASEDWHKTGNKVQNDT